MSDCSQLVIKRIGTYDLTGTRLGKGNFATVELAVNRVTKSKVAIKIIDTRKIKDEYVKRNILREALILKKIQHPNVVKLYETLKQRGVYCLVTEFVAGGELLGLIRSQHESRLTEAQARPIVRQIASALHHLHKRGIVHRDLKMENVLLDESKKNIKLVDFGLSNIIKDGQLLRTQCGSPEYAAPELFRKECRYGTEVDLWSLGVITFGMVVGKLPFRTFHSGVRGRNDLVEQMTNGLNVGHSKYMGLLSPECRDLLRRLLEPNPYIRLHLQDVMDHPWITMKGELPLKPYFSPVIDQDIIDKVLEKVSELIKMPKSKLELHLSHNRHDTISGIYNLMLDEVLDRETEGNKAITKDWKDRHIVWNDKDGKQKKSKQSPKEIIKVCIRQGVSSTEKDEHNHEDKENRKETNEKPQSNENNSSSHNEQSLQIRGMRLHSARSRDRRQARPYTTESKRTCRDVPSRTRPRSMHVKNDHQPLTPQQNLPDQPIKDAGTETMDKPAEDLESNGTDGEDRSKRSQQNKKYPTKQTYNGVSSVTIRMSELQRRKSKSPRHLKHGLHQEHGASTSTSSGTPAKNKEDINSRKLYTQSAKAKTERLLTKTAKKLGMSEKDLILADNNNNKITDSMFDIYQRYLANCKPHHKRLSIMQAHEIIHREHTFQAKYGKKQENDVKAKDQTSDTMSSDKTSIKSAQVVRREKKPQYSIRTMNFPTKNVKENETKLIAHAAQCSWFKTDILESGILRKDSDTKANGQEKGASEPVKQTDEKQQRIAQENSLRRQKQKELTEEVEREHSRIERELQDNERVKLIEQYLDDVYSRYSNSGRTLTLETTARLGTTNKATQKRKENIYSWLPKKHQHGAFGPGMASMPASILHKESSTTGCAEKKIDFKEKSPSQTKNDYNATKLRFFNEWSKKSFSNYVNDVGEFLMSEADQDFSSQFKDPSNWLKLNSTGVAVKTNSR